MRNEFTLAETVVDETSDLRKASDPPRAGRQRAIICPSLYRSDFSEEREALDRTKTFGSRARARGALEDQSAIEIDAKRYWRP